MTRVGRLFKAFVPCLVFGVVWLTAHLLDGSRTLDPNELFNAAQGWLGVLALLLLVSPSAPPRALLASAAVVPLLLVYAEAQRLGTWAGVAAGAQWLTFVVLGHGLGTLSSSGEPAPLKKPVAAAVPVAGLALSAWALSSVPRWAPIGSVTVLVGFALGLVGPSLAPERRRAVALNGVLAPLCLFASLFMLEPAAPMRGRLFACGLAFGFGWLEGRRAR
ncbi:MAG: hypothetical protein JNK82_17730 [Myxococcaceae bacterium]|nr:hypothetical protein [Myxococcaceae bacterium]